MRVERRVLITLVEGRKAWNQNKLSNLYLCVPEKEGINQHQWKIEPLEILQKWNGYILQRSYSNSNCTEEGSRKNKRGRKSSMNLKTKSKDKKRRLLIMKKDIWDVEDSWKELCCNKGWLLELGCLVPITLPPQKMPSISFRAEHFAKYAI